MEEQDAFAVLLSSQSQLPASKRRRTDQDKYAPCPICGTSVPRAFLDSHTEDCLSKGPKFTPAAAGTARSSPEKSQAPQPQLFGAASAAGPADAQLQSAVLSPRRQQRLPPDELKAMVSAGWDRALKHIPVEEDPAQQQPQQAVPQRPMQSPSTARLAAAGVPAAAAGTGAVNAFAVLQAAQAAQVPIEAEMCLEGRGDGSWLCHWRIAGTPWPSSPVPEPCWSASINANLPRQQQAAQAATAAGGSASASSSKAGPTGSVKLRLQVSTNIPPGFGGAVDWDNPLLPSNGLMGAAGGQQGDMGQPVAGHVPGWQQTQPQQQPQGAGDDAGLAAGSAGSSSTRWRGGGPGVLISALQKSVRRGSAASATKIALELLKETKTAEALARRLSIICLEDGLLHPQLPLVVWTMLALGKGYVVGGHLANALLSITHQMASISFRDFVPCDPPSVPAAGVYNAPASWHAVDAALGISSPESVLVKSILLRAAYGGMAGDKTMLLAYAGLWTARFSGCTLPPPPPPPVPAAAAGVQQPSQPHGQQQPSPAQGQPCPEEVQQPACKQSRQQAQEHRFGQQQQLGEGQHQQEQQQQQQLAEVTPPHTGQSPSQPITTTQQETPLSASQGVVLRPQWVQQQVQQPQQEQQQGSQQQQQDQSEALQSQQQGQDVLQPTQLVSTQDLQWMPVQQQPQQPVIQEQGHAAAAQQQQQQQEGPVLHPRLQVEQQEEQPKQGQQGKASSERAPQPGCGPSSSSSSQQPAQQVTPVHACPGALQCRAPQDRQLSPGYVPALHTNDGGSSSGSAGAATSSWLVYLKQHYNQLSMQDTAEPQRVTLVGPVAREDIPLAAVDFHVAPALTQHLKEQPQLKAAVRGMIATSAAVAARLSGPDGFDGLINSTIWHLRSSINRKAWIQAGYIQHSAAACTGGQVLNRQVLEAAAVAAVAAWSCAGQAAAPADIGTHLPTGHKQGTSSNASGAAATSNSMPLHTVPLEAAQQQRHTAKLPPGTGFSEGVLRVLEMEVSSMAAFEAEQRRVRQELMPLWKAGLAVLADAWCREFLSRRVY